MTHVAKEALKDCKLCLELLEKETDYQLWRIHWVAALALIRAVGHILDKVDRRDPRLQEPISTAYRNWKTHPEKHEIFWQFINKERNNILKEYQFNLHPNNEVEVLVMMKAMDPETGDTREIPQVVPIGDNIYRPLLDAYREGDDARDVYSDAIIWWDAQIHAIESKAIK